MERAGLEPAICAMCFVDRSPLAAFVRTRRVDAAGSAFFRRLFPRFFDLALTGRANLAVNLLPDDRESLQT
jgi:hypothetical protein